MSAVGTGAVAAGELVARTMIESGRDAVPVVDPIGAPIGLVTSTDLVAAVAAGTVATCPVRGD